MVHIYHGDGKGKTTAAMGLALRALSHGWRVRVAQFLKDGDSGEVRLLSSMPGVRTSACGTGGKFTFEMSAEELAGVRSRQTELLASCGRDLAEGACDLLVLDEVLDAVGTRTLAEEPLWQLIRAYGDACEIVLTGRGPSAELLDAAHYVTYMQAQKHPFDQGLYGREGVEW